MANSTNRGKLFLIPAPLGPDSSHTLPAYVIDIIHRLDIFIVERAKTARRFIKSTQPPRSLSELTLYELNKRTPPEEIPHFLEATEAGIDIGLLSEAGAPAVADPGSILVRYAYDRNVEVVPLVGPSSILLALMASGLNGQLFCFHGYLSNKRPQLQKDLRRLEQQSATHHQTQIFIETPYRNQQLIEMAFNTLTLNTQFCIAVDLTLPDEYIRTRSIAEWRRDPPLDLHKRPAVFLLHAGRLALEVGEFK